MTTNLHDFFKNYKRPNELEAYCREQLKVSGVDIYSACMEARRRTLAYAESVGPSFITRNLMPTLMHSNIVGVMRERYPHLMFTDKENCPYLKVAHDIRIYFKKLSESYTSNNIITGHVKEKRGQELFDEETKIHVLNAGPVLEKEDWMLDFKGVYAAYTNEYFPKRAVFVIDLNDNAKPMDLEVEEKGGPQEPIVKIPGREDTSQTKEAK